MQVVTEKDLADDSDDDTANCEFCRFVKNYKGNWHCHRYPPDKTPFVGEFVRVDPMDWCGEFTPY